MILFDWHKVYKESKGKSIEIIRIIDLITYKRLPKNRKDKIYKYARHNFRGDSFLVNPEQLIAERFKYKNFEVAQYIALAARRNLADYLAFRTTTLDIIQLNIPIEKYVNNRLLVIDDGLIHFKYEDLKRKN